MVHADIQAAAVRGPNYVVTRGCTLLPSREEAKVLLAAIPADTLIGARDRALVRVLLYAFAPVIGRLLTLNIPPQNRPCRAIRLLEDR